MQKLNSNVSENLMEILAGKLHTDLTIFEAQLEYIYNYGKCNTFTLIN